MEFGLLRERMEAILAERTGQPLEVIHRDTDRDYWLSAADAVAYVLIDDVAQARGGSRRPRHIPGT